MSIAIVVILPRRHRHDAQQYRLLKSDQTITIINETHDFDECIEVVKSIDNDDMFIRLGPQYFERTHLKQLVKSGTLYAKAHTSSRVFASLTQMFSPLNSNGALINSSYDEQEVFLETIAKIKKDK